MTSFLSVIPAICQSQARLTIPIGHVALVNSSQFSSDGKLIVTASNDETAKIWETVSGNLIHSLQGHNGAVMSAGFSPDGKLLLTTSEIWDVSSGTIIHTLEDYSKSVSAQFSPDGKFFVTWSSDNTIKIYDPISGENIRTIHGFALEGIDWFGRILTSSNSGISIREVE